MKVLDLFCGAGLAGRGYLRAGLKVYGVDIRAFPRNPHQVAVADALKLSPRFLQLFDLIHASPPCQADTDLKHAPGSRTHPDLVPGVRALLRESNVPYVIETVEGAALVDPVMLCGSMFGCHAFAGDEVYQLRRHRLFEASFPILSPPCNHREPVIGLYGGHVRCRSAAHGGRRTRDFEGFDKSRLAHQAMGVPFEGFTMDELSQGIPPAFTEHVGTCFRRFVGRNARAA